jgi:hypothetical protein
MTKRQADPRRREEPVPHPIETVEVRAVNRHRVRRVRRRRFAARLKALLPRLA